ncbi:MAG: acyl-CoA thioester hydrolase, partial [Eubacterium sp.]
AKSLAEKPHECEVEAAVYAHGTHFVFPEGMIKTMLPIGSSLFVSLAFKNSKKYAAECKQTRIDIDRRVAKAITEWSSAK